MNYVYGLKYPAFRRYYQVLFYFIMNGPERLEKLLQRGRWDFFYDAIKL